MKHLRHLKAVTQSDVQVIEEKERTYMGSWKLAGGRSAWFMLRRNMDRLITIMQRPEPCYTPEIIKKAVHDVSAPPIQPGIFKYLYDCAVAEDVFAKIVEDPSGKDGSMLACLRDLRRYCLLVEAEMVARGVVVPEGTPISPFGPGTPEDGGHHARDF
jgi:hypothetical protein